MGRDHEQMNWRQRIRRWWRDYEIIVIWTVAGVAYLLGCWGFALYAYQANEPLTVSEILFRSLQLFVLHGESFVGPIPWQLDLSQFLAPAASGLTAIAALGELFRHRLQLLWLRLRPPHTVVCGLGRKGLQLVRELIASGKKVVVIEPDEQNDYIEICRDLGAVVLVGDGTETEILEQARAHYARQVFAVCGNDGINVEIAVRIFGLRESPSFEKASRLECWLHIVDPILCQALKSNRMFHNEAGNFSLGITNLFENSARELFQERPLDREFIRAGDPRSVHLVIVGFGQMGQAVALQAAKIGHFANGRKLRLTILDREANGQQLRLLARYPRFANVCDIQFIQSDFEVGDIFRQLQQWGKSQDTLLSIAICLDNDSLSLRCALILAGQLEGTNVPLYVRMEEEAGLASLLNYRHKTSKLLEYVHPFGQINLSSTLGKWTNREQDDLAKQIHERFFEQRTAKGILTDDSSVREWRKLDELHRDSNRQFADHLPVKLRAIRCVIDKTGKDEQPVTIFSRPEVELLEKMEHARRDAERDLGGIQKYNYDLVELIPELVHSTSQQIYRAAKLPRPDIANLGGKQSMNCA